MIWNKRFILSCIMIICLFPAHAVLAAPNYNFNTDYDSKAFGIPTTSDIPPDYSHIRNVRVDKDSAEYPPSYGIFSGHIDTDQISRYHEQDRYNAEITSYNNTPYFGDEYAAEGFMAPTSTMMNDNEMDMLSNNNTIQIGFSNDNRQNYNSSITTVLENSDGSIGRLSIPALNLDVKVYENTDLVTMKKGVGHFINTSQWDGNVALASHNRGDASYFKGIWNLDYGDKITYKTSEGTRTYYVSD